MENFNFDLAVQQVILEQKNVLKGNKKDPEDLEKFIQKRAAGAAKIQKTAEQKGGLATLTAIHFKAKEIPYTQAEKHINDSDSEFLKAKAASCLEKLKNWDKMSQREFQAVMGQLEAYGEVYIRSKEDKGQ